MTWPAGRAATLEGDAPELLAAPGTYPVPAGRGRWRFTLHSRAYSTFYSPSNTGIAELIGARSRRLTQAWNQPAQLSFVLDGTADAAALITELAHDVIAWRWDDQTGADQIMFRGVVAQSQDTISEQVHTVTFTCHDYLKMLSRRFLLAQMVWDGNPAGGFGDQDNLVQNLLNKALPAQFSPACYLPLSIRLVDPAGATRGLSGQMRIRTYPALSVIGELIANLAAVVGGFDFDVKPRSYTQAADDFRLFYPYQGVLRTDVQLVYGSTVATVSRTVDSSQYANYYRVVGNNGTSDPNAAQLYAEAYNSDSNNITVAPQGLWMGFENASDVSIQSTLDEKAAGDLAQSGIVVPAYTIGLRPGAYRYGGPNMGDVVPLVIQHGRLHVNSNVRILGIEYDIGDDGDEDVNLAVGRPDETLTDIFLSADRDVNALARR